MYSKEQAQEFADRMIARMENPDGWKTRIWENFPGWHYEIKKGCLTVSETKQHWYYCLLNDDPEYSSGFGHWHTGVCYQNINDALDNQLKVALDCVAECQIIIDELI